MRWSGKSGQSTATTSTWPKWPSCCPSWARPWGPPWGRGQRPPRRAARPHRHELLPPAPLRGRGCGGNHPGYSAGVIRSPCACGSEIIRKCRSAGPWLVMRWGVPGGTCRLSCSPSCTVSSPTSNVASPAKMKTPAAPARASGAARPCPAACAPESRSATGCAAGASRHRRYPRSSARQCGWRLSI